MPRSSRALVLAAVGLVLAVLATLVGGAADASAAAKPPPKAVVTDHLFTYGGLSRSYTTAVPGTGGRGLPLVVFIPGTHSSGVHELQRDDLLKFVTAGRLSVVYPIGINREWNAGGGCCLRGGTPRADDAGFILALTAAVTASLRADGHRIYLMGYSAGAKMAWQIVCSSRGPFAAVATYGGNPTTSCPSRGLALPVLIGFGAFDTNEPIAGRPTNKVGIHPPAARNVNTWMARDGCSPHRRHQGVIARVVTVVGYTPCRAKGLTVQFAVWNPGNHSLPEAPLPSFGQVAWAFVSVHARS